MAITESDVARAWADKVIISREPIPANIDDRLAEIDDAAQHQAAVILELAPLACKAFRRRRMQPVARSLRARAQANDRAPALEAGREPSPDEVHQMALLIQRHVIEAAETRVTADREAMQILQEA